MSCQAVICNKIIKYSLYLLVFLLPLTFSPWTFEAYEFPKQYLLFFLVSIAFLAWLAKLITQLPRLSKEKIGTGPFFKPKNGPVPIFSTPLGIPILAFAGAAVLSALFSVDRVSSLFGFYGRFSDGLLNLASYVMLYFVIVNNVQSQRSKVRAAGLVYGLRSLVKTQGPKTKDQTGSQDQEPITPNKLLLLFVVSLGLVILISYLSIFGVWQKIGFLPKVMQQRTFSPASASFAGFLAPKTIFKNLPREAALSERESWQIAAKAALTGPKNFFFGSGVGTFHYDFAKFKSRDFNLGHFWQVRFDRPGSHIAEILATMGLLGLLAYFGVMGMFLLAGVIKLKVKTTYPPTTLPPTGRAPREKLKVKVKSYGSLKFNYQMGLFLAVIGLFVAQFFYYQNTILGFSFWLFLGLSVAAWPRKQGLTSGVTGSLTPGVKLRVKLQGLLVGGLGIGLVIAYLFLARFFWADVVYAKRFEKPANELITLKKAANLNPYQPHYRIILSRTCLNKALEELQKPVDQQDPVLLSRYIGEAIAYAKGGSIFDNNSQKSVVVKGAAEISPALVAGWETTAMIYRDIRTVVKGAAQWAINSFGKAADLEPANPEYHLQLGKLFLETDDLEKARLEFRNALGLKPDLVEAAIEDALLYEKEGDWQKAVLRLQGLAQDYPLLPQIFYELGRIYFNQREFDSAIEQFKAVLTLNPNHSNALYSLGAAYKEKGDRVQARQYFEKVLELNPGNEDVKEKLRELEK